MNTTPTTGNPGYHNTYQHRTGRIAPETVPTLAGREAWRIVTSPANLLLLAGLLLLGLAVTDERDAFPDRAGLAQWLTYVSLLFIGPVVYVSTHLVATSTRRAGAQAQLGAAQVTELRRDLALCLGVLFGPVPAALGLSLITAWVAQGADSPEIMPWTWTDVLQIPAMALGAGILAIVVARWIPVPGSLMIGLVAMIALTLWCNVEGEALRPWFGWFAVVTFFPESLTAGSAAPFAWHLGYLLAWSAVGVCAVAARGSSPERRWRWIVALAVAVVIVVVAGIAQLPV